MSYVEGGSAGSAGMSRVGGGGSRDLEGDSAGGDAGTAVGRSGSGGDGGKSLGDAGNSEWEIAGSAGSLVGDMGLAGELNSGGAGHSRPIDLSKFRGWNGIPGFGLFASGAAAVTRGPMILDVYARGTDDAFWQNFAFSANGADWSWLGWRSLGGDFSSKPGATTWRPTRDAVAIAGRGVNDQIFAGTILPPGLAPTWVAIKNDQFVKDPAITYLEPYLFLFALKANGFLYFSRNDTTTGYDPDNWTAWMFIRNGTLTSEPSVAVIDDQIFVTARGTDDTFWITSSTNLGADWTLFHRISSSTTFVFGPALVSSPNGQLNIFGTSIGSGSVWNSSSDDSGNTWTTFVSLGGVSLDGPAAASPGNGALRIFTRGIDNDIWYDMYQE